MYASTRRRFCYQRRQIPEHRAINRRDNLACRFRRAERELRGVQDLDRKPAPDAHLFRIERRAVPGRPLAAQ